MKVPKSFKMAGKTWGIEKVKDLADEEGECVYGLCDHSDLKVFLREGMPDDHEADTLLHEIIHGVDFEFQLEMSERQVSVLSTALLGVFRENPKIVEVILGQTRRTS